MSETIDWSDDPRLVAYALGEVSPADREQIERALLADPRCRAALEEIKAFLPEVEHAVRVGSAESGLKAAARDLIAAAARRGPVRRRPVWRQPAFAVLAMAAVVTLMVVGASLFVKSQAPADVEMATGAPDDLRPVIDIPHDGKMIIKKKGSESGRRSGGRAKRGMVAADDEAQNARSAEPESNRVHGRGDVATIEHQKDDAAELGVALNPSDPASELPSEAAPTAAVPLIASSLTESAAPRPKRVVPGEPAVDDFFLGRSHAEPPAADREVASESTREEGVIEDLVDLEEEILERSLDRSAADSLGIELQDKERTRQRLRVELPENRFVKTESDPLSTFSIDVDTASYTNVRRSLVDGRTPSPFDVRLEEFVNYFSYDDAPPTADDEHPFRVSVECGAAPWTPQHRLVRIGLKGRAIEYGERAPANLVFLIDVSGSMNSDDKLPLVKQALAMLTGTLEANDRVAIVVYASAQGLALPSTPIQAREAILQSLERLDAGGSTNGGAGIQLAYSVAREHFVEGGVNRVILCTDGDFNVGVTTDEGLEELIAEKASGGIDLTVLGFGTGNFQDAKMEALSNRGNGNFAYIDSEAEARKVLVTEVGGTLNTIAKDVKIQVIWNPARVQAARLIGYENRMLEHADFRDDSKDAGEIGAGHGVTALYEVVPWGVAFDADAADAGKPDAAVLDESGGASPTGPFVTVQLRYKRPGEETSVEFVHEAIDGGANFDGAPRSLRFAASVAAFAMLLRESEFVGEATLEDVRRWALESLGEDPGGLGAGFVALVETAIELRK